MPTDIPHATLSNSRAPVQKAALPMAAVFLSIGVLGVVPGLTTHLDHFTFARHHSQAALLGVLRVSVPPTVVHGTFGLAGLAFARNFTRARAYLLGGGLVYLASFDDDLVIDRTSAMNVVRLHTADNWPHLGLAAGMSALGVVLRHHVGPAGAPSDTSLGAPPAVR